MAYHADAHLADCLAILGPRSEVIVVDNDASRMTEQIARAAGAQYFAASFNVGFAAAVNLGLREGWDGTHDVLLLNPDARVNWLDVLRLQDALHLPGARRAAVGPRLVDELGVPQRADWPVPSPGHVWFDALGAGRLWRGARFVVGAVLLLRAEALSEIGGLDERYFLYAEEADWQLRAQRAGWSVAVVDDVTATHVGGASSSDAELRNRLFHASGETFARRWYGRSGWFVMRLGSLLAAARRSVVGSLESRRQNRSTLRLYLREPLGAGRPGTRKRTT